MIPDVEIFYNSTYITNLTLFFLFCEAGSCGVCETFYIEKMKLEASKCSKCRKYLLAIFGSMEQVVLNLV